MLLQRTIAKKVSVTGIGLHSGRKVTLTMHPAPADHGIQFRRTDLPNAPTLKASVETVGATENATTLGRGENCIHTVEHLMATLYGFGINNVLCEVDGPEVPIMDGSGASFVFTLKETGVKSLNKTKKFMVILHPIKVEVDDKWAMIEPHNRLLIDSTIVFPHPKIKTQRHTFEFTCESYIREIARARTFCLLKDVDALKRKGLIKGGSLDNAVVLNDFHVMNPEGLRYKNELVRHKILDTVGDLSLLGYEIAAKVTTFKSGHNLHNILCRKILENPNCYQIVSASSLHEETAKAFELPNVVTSHLT